MKVTLLNYTQDARELLLLTKGARLLKSGEIFSVDTIKNWSEEQKEKELDYMLKTIKSSWEFVDYVFMIEGGSRAFTHQFVRTRTGSSFAQQAQRVVDMSNFEYVTPRGLKESGDKKVAYDKAMGNINEEYKKLLQLDVPPQDARGVLPTNVSTNIIAKFNLRTLSDMAQKRLCPRTQGEYQDIFKEMRKLILEVHPWAEKFIRVYCAAVGVCQFPNFKECPIKGGLFNPETGRRWDIEEWNDPDDAVPVTLEEQQKLWEQMDFESIPKWKGNS